MDQQEWNIKTCTGLCSHCQKQFDDGENCYTELTWSGEGGYQRRDWCEACWADHAGELAFSVWKSVYRLPPTKDADPLKKETAESLLRQLIETEEDTETDIIFVLAVMLERKRQLVERDVKKDDAGAIIRFYEHRKTGEIFVVRDPELQLMELSHVQEKVLNMLDGKTLDRNQEAEGHTSSETPAEYSPPPSSNYS